MEELNRLVRKRTLYSTLDWVSYILGLATLILTWFWETPYLPYILVGALALMIFSRVFTQKSEKYAEKIENHQNQQ